ncbi:MAG TPA: pyrimidine 5'-nucleotidase, partial [Rhodoblastus sp.]|nr:pyrimidine 5'-nucleotidase [Rhodoblastus sp.]
ADLMPKPYAETYERFFERHGVDPREAAMFEDIAHNLEVPHARGMVTTLVTPRSQDEVEREVWEIATGDEPHIDFVTDDLAAFLEAVVK